jgi:hypothetical protein
MRNHSTIPPTALAVFLVSVLTGTALHADAPATIDISKLPASLVDDVVVPVPQEIFMSLDKLGNQDWRGEIKATGYDKLGKRSQIALLLGVVVADGFVAVQAEDRKKVEDIGGHVMRLSKALGVSESVTSHAQSIIESAQENDWRNIRQELDKVQESVRQAMAELRDEELAELVAIGGWLRGTEALSSILTKHYSEAGADILNQPDLVAHLDKQIGKMPMGTRNAGVVKEVRKGLDDLKPLLRNGSGGTIPSSTVVKVHGITTALVARIIANQG